MKNMVALSCARDFTSNGIQRAVYEALDLLDFSFAKTPKKVSLKVNLCYYWDSTTGETTDPHVVSSVIDYVRERWNDGASISVVESDASAVSAKFAFRLLGYEELATEKDVLLANLSQEPSKETSVSCDGEVFKFGVPQTILESDIFMSIPKPKYHLTGISCALKNQFGCNPVRKKFLLHPKLNQVIVALNKIMMPSLVLVDGVVVRGDSPMKLGLVMAGTNPVSVDFAVAKIMSVDSSEIEHLCLAIREGLGAVEKTDFRGVDISHFRGRFPETIRPSKLNRMTHNIKSSLSSLYLKAVDGIPL